MMHQLITRTALINSLQRCMELRPLIINPLPTAAHQLNRCIRMTMIITLDINTRTTRRLATLKDTMGDMKMHPGNRCKADLGVVVCFKRTGSSQMRTSTNGIWPIIQAVPEQRER